MSTSASPAQVRVRLWRDGRDPRDVPSEELPTLLPDDTLAWVDLVDPDDDVLAAMVGRFGLDAHAVEDAVAHHERPKVTRHPGHLFLTIYATRLADPGPLAHDSRLALSRFSAFVLPRAIVTIRSGSTFPIEEALERWADAAEQLASAAPSVRTGILVHGLLDVVVDGHFGTIQRLDDAVEDLEDLLFADVPRTREVQQSIYRLRKELVELRRVILPVREVVGALLRQQSLALPTNGPAGVDRLATGIGVARAASAAPAGGVAPAGGAGSVGAGTGGAGNGGAGNGGTGNGAGRDESAPAGKAALIGDLEDLYDHALRAAEWTESLRDMITSAFETNLSLQDARLNTVMKKLAAWAAIIAVPTAVTGWFGQNVPYPGFQEVSGLWFSAALVGLGSLTLFVVFKRQDWL